MTTQCGTVGWLPGYPWMMRGLHTFALVCRKRRDHLRACLLLRSLRRVVAMGAGPFGAKSARRAPHLHLFPVPSTTSPSFRCRWRFCSVRAPSLRPSASGSSSWESYSSPVVSLSHMVCRCGPNGRSGTGRLERRHPCHRYAFRVGIAWPVLNRRTRLLRAVRPSVHLLLSQEHGGRVSGVCIRQLRSHGDTVPRSLAKFSLRIHAADRGRGTPSESWVSARGWPSEPGHFSNGTLLT